MNFNFYRVLVLILLVGAYTVCNATTYTSITTGNWGTASTWDGNGVPNLTNNDIVVISSGNTVTQVGDIIVNKNGLIFNIYGTLIINGTLDIKNNFTFNIYSGGSVIITNVSVDNGAAIDIQGGGTATITGDLDMGNNGNANVDGSLTVNGKINVGSGTTLTGSGELTNPGGCDDGDTGDFCTSGPLPVKLISFDAQSLKESIKLSWSTASESNNDYFTLEKSRNGRDFKRLATVAGNGTASIPSHYEFMDFDPFLGLSYYRLSQTDYDGTTEVFTVISVLYTNGKANFSIYPNPLIGNSFHLTAEGKAKGEEVQLIVMNLQGKLMEKIMLRSDQFGIIDKDIQLSSRLQKGNYIFELVSSVGESYLKVVGK